jgi:hypothetical protein
MLYFIGAPFLSEKGELLERVRLQNRESNPLLPYIEGQDYLAAKKGRK